MGTFFENPMFFFMDEMEPILPAFVRSHTDPDRIVELTDVGCDTEATFPAHFSRGSFNRRRGAVEDSPTRRTIKWRDKRPRNPVRTSAALNNDDGEVSEGYDRRERIRNLAESARGASFERSRGGSYDVSGRTRRWDAVDYDGVYVDLDYDPPYAADDSFDDGFELPRNDSSSAGYADDYHAKFVRLQNTRGHARKGRQDYPGDPKSPFTRGAYTYFQRDGPSRWSYADNDERDPREAHNTDARSGRSSSSERGKRIDTSARMNKDFHRKSELGQFRDLKDYQREDSLSDASNPAEISPTGLWEFVPFGNEADSEELMFSERVDTVDSGKGGKPGETWKRNGRDGASPEIGNAERRILNNTAEMRKTVRSNSSNASSPRARSARRTSTDDRLPDTRSAEKDPSNARPRLTVEEKRTAFLMSARRKQEDANSTYARTNAGHQYRDRLVNKLSNRSPEKGKTSQPTEMSRRVAGSKIDERTCTANEKHTIEPHSENLEDNDTDRLDVSRSATEEIIEDERILASKIAEASPRMHTHTKVEKEKRFSSKLPVRTWKRLRTNEPAALHPGSDVTNEDINQHLQRTNTEIITHRNDHPVKGNAENPEKITEERATRIRNNVKRDDRFGTKLLNAGKSELTAASMKKIRSSKATGMRERNK